MGYGTNGLPFNVLRDANAARLPTFKNSHGQPAHSKEDGSDWSPAQWLCAVMGELGELAQVRNEFEAGRLTFEQYATRAAKEVADVQIYLDILARRLLDKVSPEAQRFTPSQALMALIETVGIFANDAKKYARGDIDKEAITESFFRLEGGVRIDTRTLEKTLFFPKDRLGDRVVEAHPTGINLGRAVIEKFNEVSVRVGSRVRLDVDDWHLEPEEQP